MHFISFIWHFPTEISACTVLMFFLSVWIGVWMDHSQSCHSTGLSSIFSSSFLWFDRDGSHSTFNSYFTLYLYRFIHIVLSNFFDLFMFSELYGFLFTCKVTSRYFKASNLLNTVQLTRPTKNLFAFYYCCYYQHGSSLLPGSLLLPGSKYTHTYTYICRYASMYMVQD